MNILFLCVGNSARSQIAEGLARHMLPKSVNIKSAGSMPAVQVHANAIKVMHDIGIDISGHVTKSVKNISNEFIDNLDYAITLCAEEVCPVVPKATKIFHWPLLDPDNENFDNSQSNLAFLKTREDIYNLIKKLIIEENI